MPGYILVQLVGAVLAALFLRAVINVSSMYGSNYPAHGYSNLAAFWMELALTTGLVSVILGTASGAQNIGIFGALAVGGYIALAGLWASPISGASMNPARTFGADLVSGTFTAYWVYAAGPVGGSRYCRWCSLRASRPRWRQVRLGGDRVTCSPRFPRPTSLEHHVLTRRWTLFSARGFDWHRSGNRSVRPGARSLHLVRASGRIRSAIARVPRCRRLSPLPSADDRCTIDTQFIEASSG